MESSSSSDLNIQFEISKLISLHMKLVFKFRIIPPSVRTLYKSPCKLIPERDPQADSGDLTINPGAMKRDFLECWAGFALFL